MCFHITPERELHRRDPMLYGHFLEHFYRQVYGGVFDPGSPPADEDGFRTDVVDVAATRDSHTGAIAVACVNKHETDDKEITLHLPRAACPLGEYHPVCIKGIQGG